MAVTDELVMFVSMPVTGLIAIVCDAPPVKPVPVGSSHVYNVPAGTMPFIPSTGVTSNATPLQVVAVISVGVAIGLIVTVTLNTAPVQFPDNGVTR